MNLIKYLESSTQHYTVYQDTVAVNALRLYPVPVSALH